MTEPFYRTSADGGLRFECTRCQRCCRLEPGYVFLSQRDLQALARAKALSVAEFTARYCRAVDIGGFERLSLTEKANYDCSLWEDGACTVYESRPLQCRSFPFWDANLASRMRGRRLPHRVPVSARGRYGTRSRSTTGSRAVTRSR